MKGIIQISETDPKYFEKKYDICKGIGDFDYSITIKTDFNEDFNDLISDSNNYNKCIKSHFYNDEKKLNSISEFEISIYYEKKKEMTLTECKYVSFSCSYDKTLDYIKRNPILNNMNIVINLNDELSVSSIEKIEEKFSSVNNLFLYMPGNVLVSSIRDAKESVKILEDIVTNIKSANLSPLEEIMYAYDIVRKRVYSEENKDECGFISRDLTSTILGDKIVCLGYVRFFNAIVEMLGYNARNVNIYSFIDFCYHARSAIHIVDNNYDIDGIYYFDPTFDARINENDITYLYRYNYFAITKDQMSAIDKRKFLDVSLPVFNAELDKTIENSIVDGDIRNLKSDLIKSINFISRSCFNKTIIDPCDKVNGAIYSKEKINEIKELIEDGLCYFINPIYADTFLSALLNVREAESKYECESKALSLKDIFATFKTSGWNFEKDIFETYFKNSKSDEQINYEKLSEYLNDNEVEKRLETKEKVFTKQRNSV